MGAGGRAGGVGTAPDPAAWVDAVGCELAAAAPGVAAADCVALVEVFADAGAFWHADPDTTIEEMRAIVNSFKTLNDTAGDSGTLNPECPD
jgi:hypothetical protein